MTEYEKVKAVLESYADELAAIAVEAREAQKKWGAYNSLHEAYAVLAEEMDELWDEVRKRQYRTADAFADAVPPENTRTAGAIRKEAIQIAAVALRIAADAQRMAEK